MSAEEDLAAQVEAASVPIFMTSKSEIVEWYRDTYGASGKGGRVPWKQHIVHDLSEQTGIKPKTLEKRFEKRIETRENVRTRAQYAELGRKLPPIGLKVPPGGYRVTFHGLIRISKDCYPRHFSRVVKVARPEDLDFAAIFNAYFEEDLAEEYCGEPQISVAPAA